VYQMIKIVEEEMIAQSDERDTNFNALDLTNDERKEVASGIVFRNINVLTYLVKA